MKIYLAGSVPKGDKEAADFVDWRKTYIAAIQQTFPKVQAIDPNNVFDLEGDSLAVFGADCTWIQEADFVVVHAEKKLGAGTAMEYVIAKYMKKPVITVLPRDTHHRRSNLVFEGRLVEGWIHPFIEVFSDAIVESPDDLAEEIKRLQQSSPIKDLTVIPEGIKYAKQILKASDN